MVGLVGLEPTTPALSRRCSNQLSYRPFTSRVKRSERRGPLRRQNDLSAYAAALPPSHFTRAFFITTERREHLTHAAFSRKEVIQPHLPIRLPCYDFTPVTNPTVVTALLTVRLTTSGKTHSHGVTGGVYKARERIHRDMLIRDY